MIEDAELLRRYAADRSEAAFAELVQRHLALVYSVARRQVEPDRHLAEDVAQKVFADLARKAGALSRHPVLTGWLYRSTQFTAIDLVRSERRRRAREQEAQTMQEIMNDSGAQPEAEKLRPVLDQAMGELGERDRDAVMLRFYEGRPFAEVGRKLQLTDDAARRRVERALDKLRTLLEQRGVTSTTAALTATLASQAAGAPPVGLAAAVTGGVLTTAGAGAGAAVATFMTITKVQVAIFSTLLVAGAGGFVLQQRENARLEQEIGADHARPEEIAKLQQESQGMVAMAQEVRSYRDDAAELASLRDRAGQLSTRFQAAAAARETGGAGGTIYPAEQLQRAPTAVVQSAPVYPFALLTAGIEGTVVVSLVVGQDGAVTGARVTKSTEPGFDDAALAAVKRWRFTPGQKDGAAVNAEIKVPIVFSISDKPMPAWF